MAVGTAILYRMGYAIPGDVNRGWSGLTIEPNYADPNNTIPAYGMPVKLNALGTGVNPLGVADTEGAIFGILVRPYPKQAASAPSDYGQQQLSDSTPPPTKGEVDVLKRGYIGVHVNSGSAAGIQKGAPAYIWNAATTAGHTQGQFEGAPTVGSTIAVPGYFMGPCDANGNTELAYNL